MNLTLFASIFALLINQSFACDCGRPDYTMMGRSKGLLSRFPWYVVIENKNLKSCGAALIDDQHAVIAAHCLSGSDASSLGARLNDNSTKSIASIWVDERYNNETGAYDFAVLTLDSPVGSQFQPICLLDPAEMLWPGTTLISQKAGKSFEEYRREYYPTSKCPSPATQTHVCILNPTKGDRCAEGPFMRYEMNERFYLTSITSRCFSTGTPDLFTDVSLFNEKMRELAPKGCWRDKWDWSGTMFDRNQF